MPLTHEQIAHCIEMACTDEVMAPKPGNVHPGAGFHDMTWRDFVDSARVVAPILARTDELGVGRAVHDAVAATRGALGRNTNLGIVLLLAPLCKAARGASLVKPSVKQALSSITLEDSRLIYRAITIAKPGGLGSSERADVNEELNANQVTPIVQAMKMAQERDLVARQWANGFEDVFEKSAAWIREELPRFNNDRLLAIVSTHVRLMAALPDTLIQRKLGVEMMRQAARKAQVVQELGGLLTAPGRKAFDDLDRWLRADGNKRNPGATADLIAAGLFVIEAEKAAQA